MGGQQLSDPTRILHTQHTIVEGLMRGLRGLLQDPSLVARRPRAAWRILEGLRHILDRHDAAERRIIRRVATRGGNSSTLLMRGFENGLDSLRMLVDAHQNRWDTLEAIQADNVMFVRDTTALLDCISARFRTEEAQVHPWLVENQLPRRSERSAA